MSAINAPAFTILIPARMASTRLPEKPLADIGGAPMVARVAQRARLSQAQRVVVVTDHARILDACAAHGVEAIMTRVDHPSGSDRLAEACDLLALSDESCVVNVQGDEPLIDPVEIDAVAALLAARSDCAMSTLAAPLRDVADFVNPNVVKLVLDSAGRALYFSRAPMPWWRDGFAQGVAQTPPHSALRHIGLYGYRVGFLRAFPTLAPAPLELLESLEQLRALWHGHRIAVHVADHAPGQGVDTPEDLERVRALFASGA
jgi:3-deoxy-manno-octulosonate cytidylyltransferase (CMP-KDO synthetase)